MPAPEHGGAARGSWLWWYRAKCKGCGWRSRRYWHADAAWRELEQHIFDRAREKGQ